MRSVAAALLLAAALAVPLDTLVRRADREPHHDEIEFLHASWMVAQGARLYVDFFEHHPPFLFAALAPLTNDDVRASFTRARFLSGACGFVALCAFAAILRRVRPDAAAIGVALVFASAPHWMRGLADVRPEPFALAFFWLGAALVLLPRGSERSVAMSAGIGVGLVAVAGMWNPKWPLAMCVVGVASLVRARRRWWIVAAIAVGIAAIALLAARTIAPLDAAFFFTFEFNRVLAAGTASSPYTREVFFGGGKPFLLMPVLLRPAVMIVASLFALRLRKNPIAVVFVALAVASLLELRFVLAYPTLWEHYYTMWMMAVAGLVALIPAAVATWRPRVALAVTATLLVVIAAHIVAGAPIGSRVSDDGPYWVSQRYLQSRLGPGETVWTDVPRHPVAVPDAHYYWMNAGSITATGRGLAAGGHPFLPPPSELPYCAPPPSLRYLAGPRLLAGATRELECFERLRAQGRVRVTPVPDVWEVVR